jgi:hypothetical protein
MITSNYSVFDRVVITVINNQEQDYEIHLKSTTNLNYPTSRRFEND